MFSTFYYSQNFMIILGIIVAVDTLYFAQKYVSTVFETIEIFL